VGFDGHAARIVRQSLRRLICASHALGLAALVSACGARQHAKPTSIPSAKPAPALHQGPLSDFVPAASLRWLVLAKPPALFADPELGSAISQIISARRLDAFDEASGVDLRKLEHGAVAGFPYATLYLAELPAGVAANARQLFADRLLSGATTKQVRPNLMRITGVVGQTPETLLTADDRLLAVSVGDPLPAKIAEAYAEGRLKASPTALRGAALSTLPDLTADNPAVLLAPGPFADEWKRAASGLLESAVALGVGIKPIGSGKIVATICVAGTWGQNPDSDIAARRLATAWSALTQSSAGHLFQLNPDASVSATAELLTLHVELELEPLMRGLKAAVFSDVSELLQFSNRRETSPPNSAPNTTP
jgi:hypothetical protein